MRRARSLELAAYSFDNIVLLELGSQVFISLFLNLFKVFQLLPVEKIHSFIF